MWKLAKGSRYFYIRADYGVVALRSIIKISERDCYYSSRDRIGINEYEKLENKFGNSSEWQEMIPDMFIFKVLYPTNSNTLKWIYIITNESQLESD